MQGRFKTPYLPFSAALRRCVEENITTVKQLCEVGQVSDQTIRNWCADLVRVDEDVAHRLATNHPSSEVRRILTDARNSGGEIPAPVEVGETDLDKDGRTTAHDAILSLAEVVEHAGTEMRQLLAESGDGFNDQEIQRAMNGLSKLKHEVIRTMAAVEKSTRGQRPRLTG